MTWCASGLRMRSDIADRYRGRCLTCGSWRGPRLETVREIELAGEWVMHDTRGVAGEGGCESALLWADRGVITRAYFGCRYWRAMVDNG